MSDGLASRRRAWRIDPEIEESIAGCLERLEDIQALFQARVDSRKASA